MKTEKGKLMHLGDGLGELKFTIEVKRADTGEIEQHEFIGKVMTDGSDTLSGSPASSD